MTNPNRRSKRLPLFFILLGVCLLASPAHAMSVNSPSEGFCDGVYWTSPVCNQQHSQGTVGLEVDHSFDSAWFWGDGKQYVAPWNSADRKRGRGPVVASSYWKPEPHFNVADTLYWHHYRNEYSYGGWFRPGFSFQHQYWQSVFNWWYFSALDMSCLSAPEPVPLPASILLFLSGLLPLGLRFRSRSGR